MDRLACADREGNVAVWCLSTDEELGIRAEQELFLTLGALTGAAAPSAMRRTETVHGQHSVFPAGETKRRMAIRSLQEGTSAPNRASVHGCAGADQDVHLSWHPHSQDLVAVTARDGVLLVGIEQALSGGGTGTIVDYAIDALPAGLTLLEMEPGAQPSAVAFSPDGALLAAGGSDCQVCPALPAARTSRLHWQARLL